MAADRRAQYEEGPKAAQRFQETVHRVLSVSKDELAKREATYQKARANKDRPGPRRRVR